ncbi:MAG: hypothetical protein IH831_05295, partial [Planctomycetes bacterium]|nr:hypothetical protein [Planctomycetota bacterium]
NVSAQQALTEHLSELKQALNRNGISLDRIDVQVNPLRSETESRQHSDSHHHRDSQPRDRDTYSGEENRNGSGDSHEDDSKAEVEPSEIRTSDALDAQV